MKIILSLLFVAVAVQAAPSITAFKADVRLSGPCNSYDREKLNEGYRTCVYKDSKNIPTIGVGFNLEKFGAKSEIESVGADYNAVLNGSKCLDDRQIEELFNKDMSSAVSCIEGWLSSLSRLSESAQSALADMAFNLGCGQLREFSSLKNAVSQSPPDYDAAVSSMKDSLWCRQVGSRCERDVECMR